MNIIFIIQNLTKLKMLLSAIPVVGFKAFIYLWLNKMKGYKKSNIKLFFIRKYKYWVVNSLFIKILKINKYKWYLFYKFHIKDKNSRLRF